MRIRAKLMVIIAFAAMVPLIVSAFTALRVHRTAFENGTRTLQENTARYRAELVHRWMTDARRNLTAVSSQIPWPDLSARELEGALVMLYGQLDAIVFAQLVVPGAPQTASLSVSDDRSNDTSTPRGRLTPSVRAQLVASVPAPDSSGKPAVFGDVMWPQDADEPMIALAIRVPGGSQPWTVVVGLTLASLCRDVLTDEERALSIAILDRDARQLCPIGSTHASRDALVDVLGDTRETLLQYRDAHNQTVQAAVARTPLGWTILAHQPLASAIGPSEKMQRQTWYWLGVSLVIAVSSAWYLARGIDGPIRKLTEGARQIARGNTSHRLAIHSRDEFGALSDAFDHMSEQIEQRDEEIKTWNESLQQRVVERTRELQEAQSLLLRSQKLAAVSSLAAGMAHEINNPLTSVLGMAQVLEKRARNLRDDPSELRALSAIQDGANRISEIVSSLRSLAQRPGMDDFTELDGRDVVTDVVTLLDPMAREHSVILHASVSDDRMTLWGSASRLEHALTQLVRNAITATPPGGQVVVSVIQVTDEITKFTIKDTGCGIPREHLDRVMEPFFTTKQDWRGRGLGLTVAHEIVTAHGGMIKIESDVHKGTNVTVTLSSTNSGVHLV